jgi:membrane fusion protein, multidrug efflux system
VQRHFTRKLLLFAAAIVCAVIVVVVGFTRSNNDGTLPPAPPLEVLVADVDQKDIPIRSEWLGTLDGFVNADIKAQVSGYILRAPYTEGSFVRKGQLLFEIDARPFQAALAEAKGELAKAQGERAQANSQLLQARAQLAQAEANQLRAQLDVDRYTPLAKERAITTQEFDNAVQGNIAAKAQVEAARADVETAASGITAADASVEAERARVRTAELNLSFTRVTSPIDGIAGIAQAQVGDLVNTDSDPLTTVSTLDPIKVYFTVSEQEYLTGTRGKGLKLDLVLADGTTHPHKGRFAVVDREVDPRTGTIRMLGLFPNPGNTLRPGQYAKVRAVTATKRAALLVPQRAVMELQGSYQVAVVGPDNKVSIRRVKVGPRVDSLWVIEEGLQPGERVVVEGIQKVRPDAVVNPKKV